MTKGPHFFPHPIKHPKIEPYNPDADTQRYKWTGDEKAAERAFNNFAQRRDRNPTVQQKRGFGKRNNSEVIFE